VSEQGSPAGVDPTHLEPLCSLDDPSRRRLYDYVVARAEPVTRDRASEALGIDRSTVAYHLDRLVEEGLLLASFARPPGRTGPGAGRPAKHYERSGREFAVSVPPRDYRLAAELLARAAEADTTGTVRRTLDRAAADLGREWAADDTGAAADLLDHLAQQGFEPYRDGEVVRLRNCPFHRLAREHTELVCGMNLALLGATVEAAGAAFEARLEPAEDRCCVAFAPTGG
jgi:predicted ArsR family transcriptional regulator